MELAVEVGIRTQDRGVIVASRVTIRVDADDSGIAGEVRSPIVQVGQRCGFVTVAKHRTAAAAEKVVHGLYGIQRAASGTRQRILIAWLKRLNHILPVSGGGPDHACVD